MDDIIRAEGLIKRFGDLTAVDNLDISVKKGEIYGFLGPNGAGKTTTIRMLTTIDLPDAGQVWIDGHETRSDFIGARRCVGVIQQQNSLDKDLTVRENIFHHALMQNLPWKEAKKRTDEAAATMDLTGKMDIKVEKLSGGWKKRVAIVCSLIHSPEVLFMDEPTTGLDTQSRNLLWKMIRQINRSGTTIFLTTHYIFEAEHLCNRVGIIDGGKLIAEGTPEELKEGIGKFAVVFTSPDGDETVSYHETREDAKEASMKAP